jgi:hypothetical protein
LEKNIESIKSSCHRKWSTARDTFFWVVQYSTPQKPFEEIVRVVFSAQANKILKKCGEHFENDVTYMEFI